MKSPFKKNGKCFTILELLIVVAVIAILVSLLLPSLDKAREQARRAVCLSNVSQICRAGIAFSKNNKGSLPHGHKSIGDTGHGDFAIKNNNKFHGAGRLIKEEYLTDPRIVYCPSTSDWKVLNGRCPNPRWSAEFGGYQEDTGWLKTTVSSYGYRSSINGNKRANIFRDDVETALWADHFISGNNKFTHKDSYSVVYLGGYARWYNNSNRSIELQNIGVCQYGKQEVIWQRFDD
jgi:type II secretory pathway pseudopilin PulG